MCIGESIEKSKPLLDVIVKEFIFLVSSLETDYSVENNRIIIDKELFKSHLLKYSYLSFSEKTKIYKSLNFIIHDKNNYTMPCKDKDTKKTIRKVVINYDTYLCIKHLFENKVIL